MSDVDLNQFVHTSPGLREHRRTTTSMFKCICPVECMSQTACPRGGSRYFTASIHWSFTVVE